MAAWTKAPLLTREGHEHLVRTTGAADAGESEVEVAAAEKLAGHIIDDRAPWAVALLVTLAIGALELGIVTLAKPVERRLPRLTTWTLARSPAAGPPTGFAFMPPAIFRI